MENNFLLRFIVEEFFHDDDEDLVAVPRVIKIENYVEDIVPKYSDRQFQSHFRMSPTTFERLLTNIYQVETEAPAKTQRNPEISTEKQLLLTLWYLANLECYRTVADRFGVSTSTAWNSVFKICKKLLLVNTQYGIITFPDEDQHNMITENFRRNNGFPGILGAIDGSHIPIKAPIINANSYINRKNFHSVLLQGICDNKKRFLDCYAGEAGSIHDACLLRRSDFGQTLPNRLWPQDRHLIGDAAYPLSMKILVPFKDNGHLTRIQKKFNVKLSQNRVVIEHAFALLKGRFRRLKLLEAVRLDLIPLLIICTCILHNICLETNDIPLDIELNNELEEERIMQPNNMDGENIDGNNALAIAKRNNIANLLSVRY